MGLIEGIRAIEAAEREAEEERQAAAPGGELRIQKRREKQRSARRCGEPLPCRAMP